MPLNIAKSQSLIRSLIDQISHRLPSYTLQEQNNNFGDMLMISQSATPTAGQSNWAIRIVGQDTPFTDVIGLQQSTYTPFVAQVIEESSTIAGVSLIPLAVRVFVEMELAKLGIKQQRFLSANATVPALSMFDASDANVTGATLEVTLAADQYWPLSGQ